MSTVTSSGLGSHPGDRVHVGAAETPSLFPDLRLVSGRPWHERFNRATARYKPLRAASVEHMEHVAFGVEEWAGMLPQAERDDSGRSLPANRWGLGPELSELRMIIVQLKLQRRRDIAEELKTLTDDLRRTAQHLDECYPKASAADEASEQRLLGLARIQASRLADLLRQLNVDLRRVRPTSGTKPSGKHGRAASQHKAAKAPTIKRAGLAAAIEALKKELIEHIKAARDHVFAAIHAKRTPTLLPRPTKVELGRRIGIGKWKVSRCFDDRFAQELRLLWEVAGDLDMIMKFRR